MTDAEHRGLALPQGTRIQDFEFHRVLDIYCFKRMLRILIRMLKRTPKMPNCIPTSQRKVRSMRFDRSDRTLSMRFSILVNRWLTCSPMASCLDNLDSYSRAFSPVCSTFILALMWLDDGASPCLRSSCLKIIYGMCRRDKMPQNSIE